MRTRLQTSLVALLVTIACRSAPAEGQTWFGADFEGKDALQGWTGRALLEPGYNSAQSVALDSRAPATGAVISKRLGVEDIRGCTLRGSVMVRAEGVSPKPNPWNGIKCMLVIESPSGKSYPQAPLDTGSFDWRRARFSARISPDATNVTLVLGLEQVAGKVWFDELQLVVARRPVNTTELAHKGPRFKGHNLPRLRGAMISPNIDAASLRLFGKDWNANLIRWQLIRTGGGASAAAFDYDTWLEGELKKLDAALPVCQEVGLMVVVDLHSPPGGKATAGGYFGSDAGLFTARGCQDKFVAVWQKLAARYKEAKPIWGYDLVNEPVDDDVAEDCQDWQGLAERTARAVREIDPNRTIIVEPAQWGGPDALRDFVPLPVSNVVYSVHMYLPHAFTHQNVHRKGPQWKYPGEIEGQHWDKERLCKALQPVVDFQQRYNVHMYIGEFSAIRWAPENSAYRYLSDLIDIFEAQGWDWTYHAFREWNGWSVEHGPDRGNDQRAATPTDRQKLLTDWFSRNKKPNQ